MADESHRNHAPVPTDGGVPPTQPPASCRAELDANGFDPNEFEWRPVPRRPRADGWTPDVQRRFIQALAETGVVEHACREVGMSVGSAYRLRDAPGAEGFARAWHDARMGAAERLLDVCFERAIQGWDEPVFDRDGVRIGAKWKFDHRLAVTLLRAYFPERFRHATRDTRRPDEPPPPVCAPVAKAVERLGPVTPDAPHLLTERDRMAEMIDGARGLAEAEALYPRDESEPYVQPRVQETHPISQERKAARHRREADREWRAMTDEEREEASRPFVPPPYRGNPDDPWYDETAGRAADGLEHGEEDDDDMYIASP